MGGVAEPCKGFLVDGVLVQGRVPQSLDEGLRETEIREEGVRVPRVLLDIDGLILVIFGGTRRVTKGGVCVEFFVLPVGPVIRRNARRCSRARRLWLTCG